MLAVGPPAGLPMGLILPVLLWMVLKHAAWLKLKPMIPTLVPAAADLAPLMPLAARCLDGQLDGRTQGLHEMVPASVVWKACEQVLLALQLTLVMAKQRLWKICCRPVLHQLTTA